MAKKLLLMRTRDRQRLQQLVVLSVKKKCLKSVFHLLLVGDLYIDWKEPRLFSFLQSFSSYFPQFVSLFSLFFLPNRRSSRSFEEPSFFMSKIHSTWAQVSLSWAKLVNRFIRISCLLSYGHFYSKWPKFPKILLFTYPDHRPWGLLVKHLFAIFVVSPKSGGACIHCRINSTGSWRIKPVIGWIYQIKSSAVGTHA